MNPFLLIGVCALAALGYWWYLKRRPTPVEDEWVLPPASEAPAPHLTRTATPLSTSQSTSSGAGASTPASGSVADGFVDGAEGDAASGPGATAPSATPTAAPSGAPAPASGGFILDREFLLNRDRTFDPSKWDNSPDPIGAAEPEVAGDFPKYFDREYLEKQARERGQG